MNEEANKFNEVYLEWLKATIQDFKERIEHAQNIINRKLWIIF